MTDLFEQVLHQIEGTETEIQNWQTLDGIKTVEFQSFGPDRWIESVHENGRLMAIDCLALVLFTVRKSFDLEQERRIVEGWAVELRKAVSTGEIQARDPVTLLALETLPDGWEWLLSMADADKFIATRGMEWRFGEVSLHLFNECEQAIQNRHFPPWTRTAPATTVTAPEQSPATPATVVPALVEPDKTGPADKATAKPATNWRMQIQAEAYEHWIRLLASGCSPTPNSILDYLVTWCATNNVRTDTGIYPGAGHIKNTVINGRLWPQPTMSREQAKKHVAQVEQVAHSKAA
jgi:hypothetical protein